MRLFWHRRRQVLAGGLLLGMLVVCALLGLGGAVSRVTLPSVLLRNDWIWIGDLCRATQSCAIMYLQPCEPGYTVDVVIYGRAARHYTLLRLPNH